MNINDLRPGDKIEITNDSMFCINTDFEFNISVMTWAYTVKYSSVDYLILDLNVIIYESLYLVGNCDNIIKIE